MRHVVFPKFCFLVLLWPIFQPLPLSADEPGNIPKFTVGGLLFGDLYHVASHHTTEGDGATGYVLRRGYLTFDARFSAQWFGRVRIEANQAGEFETYTYSADFKDVYLGLNLGRHQLLAGLSPTPTFDLIESVWGLRYLARTPMDLQGEASRDTGLSAKGPLNTSGSFSYRAMLASGLEFGNESGDKTKLMGALTWRPAGQWVVDLYADFEDLPGRTDRSTVQLFTGYQTNTLRWGIQYSHQDRQEDAPLELASLFAVRRVGGKISLVGRIDRLMEPSPQGDGISYLPFDPSARATLFMGGIEFAPAPHFVITPNVVVTSYDRNDEGIRPQSDIHLRLTLFINFE
jgi:hypothetical protein